MQIDSLRLEEWYRRYQNISYTNISENSSEIQTMHQILQKCGYDLSSLENVAIDYAIGNIEDECKILLAHIYNTDPENVLICNGASEALFITMLYTIKKNTNIVIEDPFYKRNDKLVHALQGEIIPWHLIKNNSMIMDTSALRKIANKKTKSILVNHPHNPTGLCVTNSQLMEITEIADRSKSYVISDEVTLPLLSDTSKIFTPAANLYDKAISISSLSKLFGAPGLRIGWIIAEKSIINQCQNFKDHITISNSTVSLLIGKKLLENWNKILEKNIRISKNNIEYMDRWIKNNSDWIAWCKPKAGFCAFPKLLIPVHSRTFCKKLIEKKSIFLVPGDVFGYDQYFRIGVGGNPKAFRGALNDMEDFMQQHMP